MECDAYIALGGNEGDVVATMDAALGELDSVDGIAVLAVSKAYETAPVGADAGGAFINAAAHLQVSLSPNSLLSELKQVECRLGRQASDRWTSRIIDLDLILAGDAVCDEAGLTLPHPHLWYRRFVLDPLVDVAANAVHPEFCITIEVLRDRLVQRPLVVSVNGGCAEDRLAVGSVLRKAGFEFDQDATDLEGPLRIDFDPDHDGPEKRVIELSSLPGSFLDATNAIVTAVLDEPQPHSRPLRRMP